MCLPASGGCHRTTQMKKLFLITICCLLFAVFVQDSIADKDSNYSFTRLRITKLHSGKADKTIKIVIVGDGYTEKDLVAKGKYESDCERLVSAFLKKAPFQKYQDYFAFYAIYALSYDRGAENNPGEGKKRNILDCTVETNPDGTPKNRLIRFQKPERLGRIVKNAWVNDLDTILVIVNDSREAGSGNTLVYNKQEMPAPTFTNAGDFENAAMHEFGHSFADLADEYVDCTMIDKYVLPATGDLTNPNVTLAALVQTDTKESLEETLKWRHFLKLPGAEGVIGLYSGGHYRPKGVYRSQADCFMRTFGFNVDFCFVCQEAIVRAIYRKTGLPFDDQDYHRQNPIKVKVKEDYLTLFEKDIGYYFDGLFAEAEKSVKKTKGSKKGIISPLEKTVEEYAQWLEKPGFITTLPIKNQGRLKTLAVDLRNRLKAFKKSQKIE